MKQDIIFFAFILLIFFIKKPKYPYIGGLICLILAIPLFSFWKFYTAERLTWYAAAFFLLEIFFIVFNTKNKR